MSQKIKPFDQRDKCPLSPADLERLLELLKTIRFGSITIIIQDGHVIQMDKNEKLRLK